MYVEGGGGGVDWSRCSLRHMSAHLNSGGLAESTVEHDQVCTNSCGWGARMRETKTNDYSVT